MRKLVLQTEQTTGPAWTPEFTVTQGPYEVGYAYDCQAAPAAREGFQLSVVTVSGPVSPPVVASRDLKGAGTAVVSVTGQQKLYVETAAECQWVLRVIAP